MMIALNRNDKCIKKNTEDKTGLLSRRNVLLKTEENKSKIKAERIMLMTPCSIIQLN